MQVDELCGPIMASRGGWRNGERPSIIRQAALAPGRHHPGSDIIDLDLRIHTAPGKHSDMESSRRIHLYIKQKHGQDPFDIYIYIYQWGTFVQWGGGFIHNGRAV
jgi:hypothetical protein